MAVDCSYSLVLFAHLMAQYLDIYIDIFYISYSETKNAKTNGCYLLFIVDCYSFVFLVRLIARYLYK